jgi:hypothetical protein
LAAAVIGDDDPVAAGLHRAQRILPGHHSLEHEWAVPCVANPAQVLPPLIGVEQLVDEAGQALATTQRAEAAPLGGRSIMVVDERRPGEVVRHPAGAAHDVQCHSGSYAHRHAQTVADVALAVARDRRIGCDDEHAKAALARQRDSIQARLALPEEVELKPLRLRDARRDLLHRQAGAGHPREPRGSREHRERQVLAEHLDIQPPLRHASQHARGEREVLEGAAVLGDGELVVGGAIDVVKDRFREPPCCGPADLGGAHGATRPV